MFFTSDRIEEILTLSYLYSNANVLEECFFSKLSCRYLLPIVPSYENCRYTFVYFNLYIYYYPNYTFVIKYKLY